MSSITGSTRVFFILGDPVAQVKAPTVYNALFQQHGIDAVLVPLKLPVAALPGFLQHGMAAENIGGFWATIPHKAALFEALQPTDPVAVVAGAVNAVKRHADGRLEAALFDGIGFVKGLDHFGIGVPGKKVLVVGAGGGGQAVAAALARRQPAVLAIYNRTRDKARRLAERLSPLMAASMAIRVADDSDPAGYDLIVNCTSQGLKPDDPLPFDPARVDAGAAVVDIIMKTTPLLAACAARGITAHAGDEMLVQQIPAYLRFMGYPQLADILQADLAPVRAMLASR